jgi:hypothetical protein
MMAMNAALLAAINLARSVRREHVEFLFGKPNVVTCGVGFKESQGVVTDEPCVVVGVTKKVPLAQLTAQELVPKVLPQDVKTDVVEVGRIRAFQDPKDRWRPAPGGVSIGHYAITAGTLGCLATKNNQIYILSNNHVLANSNDAKVGDAILQPGTHDGGTLADKIATLAEFVPIDFGDAPPECGIATGVETLLNVVAKAIGSRHRISTFQESPGTNVVDCALGLPDSPDVVKKEILHVGVPKGVHEAALGTAVQKSGRTTGHTTGQINQIDVTAQVAYGNRVAVFTDQLMAGAMSAGGDSGSAVLDDGGYVVGLLFAGSETTTLMNPIQAVLDGLGVQIVT